ncbi:GNAT family N-acetyltransferase [Aspergillus stella-maris]|uniref:GNAT family N-acetyltransferase n=1 Tax=Aspergillus stella-maris TaxID=1810926 RepID=UPI003CCD2D9C
MPSQPQPPLNQKSSPSQLSMAFQTARLQFTPLVLSDTEALHDLRTSPSVMKWSRQKTIDKNLRETENWIRKMTDEPLLDLETGEIIADSQSEGEKEKENAEKNITKTGISFAVRELSHVEEVSSANAKSKAKAEGGETVAMPDKIIAIVGIRTVQSPLTGNSQFELGYMFVPRTWGKGYASEAVKGIVEWWFEFLGSRSTTQTQTQGGGEGGIDVEGQKQGEQKSKEIKDQDGVYAIVAKDNAASLRVMEKCGFSRVNEGFDDEGGLNEIVEFRIGREEVM